MKDKKILENRNADEILNDDELEKISGGYTGDADYVNKDFGYFLTSEEFNKLLEQQQNK